MQKRPHYHANRVNEDIARELMVILRDVKDPRVSGGFVSVIKTETTPDLKFCKVYYSNLGGNDKEVKTGLYSALGYIRRELANRLSLRNTPELTFIKDTGAAHGARISELLKEIEAKTPEDSESRETEPDTESFGPPENSENSANSVNSENSEE